jgi:hypothetical protein
MAAAGLMPRVRMMAICDRVRESKTEVGVFNLKGVRQFVPADVFPFVPRSLWLFLVLSSPRPGEFPGYVRVIHDRTDKAVFFAHLARPTFGPDGGWLASGTSVRCRFPEPGLYTIQVWFFQLHGSDILKGEMPLTVENEGI